MAANNSSQNLSFRGLGIKSIKKYIFKGNTFKNIGIYYRYVYIGIYIFGTSLSL